MCRLVSRSWNQTRNGSTDAPCGSASFGRNGVVSSSQSSRNQRFIAASILWVAFPQLSTAGAAAKSIMLWSDTDDDLRRHPRAPPMPTLHVSPLSKLHETVASVRASHLV